ncbi:unnamed protein product [Notodromas monacha]|uniref:Nucleoside-diphosphate kinase n=1 Tax=Notodromas monacha TaxID=399045 RepID=A0A7R9GIV7_9CRUS|nr:unnamed protein product [Notodromas monacha]CAG0924343.1 unnamed protein product [Notodromas monacha]
MGCGASHDGDASSVHADPGTPVVKRIVGEERRGSSTSSASSSSASARAKRELSAARDLLDQEPGSEAEPEPEWAQQDQLKGEEAEESEVVQTARVKTAPPKRISATEPPIFFIVGGPGSGKGTQCQKLKEKYNLMHVSTGEILRNEVATGSDLGKTIDLHMRSGSLISTDIVMSLLKKTLDDNPRAEGFLIDGFPRDVQQIELFESQIRPVDLIIYLEAPDEKNDSSLSTNTPNPSKQRTKGVCTRYPYRTQIHHPHSKHYE